ncbi:hypothetical protein CEXT_210081 [Caerostris extrusa]|uniref:Uncharacterized protein n=1 Tax=Caerostris extrusa TaxID=172846 RepID=A0AAV4WLK6_CAEEX|nr:hypothetical protein CEXT_210081 [Caerostris extrusa]
MIVRLIQNGANMHFQDRNGCTPLNMMMGLTRSDVMRTFSLRHKDLYKKFSEKSDSYIELEDILASAKALFKFDILKNKKRSVLFQDWYLRAIPLDLRHYLKACMKEIHCMQLKVVQNNFSLYNFIMEDVKPPEPRSVCSEHVLKYIFVSSMKIGFPYLL